MQDTIAAIATGGGVSAIGIIRVSGRDAVSVTARVFSAQSGVTLECADSRRLYYGELRGTSGAIIDRCVCTVSRAPHSYTGEDTAELHCHGSPIVLAECLRALFACGARQAMPGEFTQRAFLNGKMDLSQAEAVIDLIESETALAAINAAGQLGGAVRDKAERVYNALIDITAHFHAVIDYPDEDIEDFKAAEYLGTLRDSRDSLSRMLKTFERGKILRDGVPAAIIGRPNAGKSSLLNALAGYDRAIVTEIAGTTRDTIEEKLVIGGVPLRLVDTAGLRETGDVVERLGVERSYRALETAELAILVFDGSAPLCEEDRAVIKAARRAPRAIAVINKSDLMQRIDCREIPGEYPAVSVSAVTGEGLDALETEIAGLFPLMETAHNGEIITNARQAEALGRAAQYLDDAAAAISSRVTPDAALTELESALSALGEITGRTLREDTTARIFERFCVGK